MHLQDTTKQMSIMDLAHKLNCGKLLVLEFRPFDK